MTTWNGNATNEDGLVTYFGTTGGTPVTDGTAAGKSVHVYEKVIVGSDLPAISEGGRRDIASLPAGAIITDAYVKATTGFGTDTGTLTIGLADTAGSAVDADGIDAAIDVSAVLAAADDVVLCDGALVDKTEALGEECWVYATASGTVTTGTVVLKIMYIL